MWGKNSAFPRRWLILSLGLVGAVASAEPGSAAVLGVPPRTFVGDPLPVVLSSDKPLEGVTLLWLGTTLSLDVTTTPGGWSARGLVGTEAHTTKPGPGTLEFRGSEAGIPKHWKQRIAVLPKTFGTARLSLDEAFVTPPKDVLARIARERILTAAAKSRRTLPQRWTLPMTRPVPGKITGPYGKRYILNGKPRSPHRGLDFRAPLGTPVRTLAAGVVALTGDHYYAGKSVYVDHGGGVISFYMHLSEIAVREGDLLRAGDPVGKSGSTGRSTGPHLHLGVALQGRLVDPSPLF